MHTKTWTHEIQAEHGWHRRSEEGSRGGDCELTQGVDPGQERGFGVVLCKLWTLVAFITAEMGAICSTTVPLGTRLHWSTDSQPVWVGWDGMASVVDGRHGWQTKINWTKTAHNTCICSMHICGHLGLVQIHSHTPLCGYGLSTGPEGLRLWWLRNQSTPDSQQQQQTEHFVETLMK